MKRLFNKNNPVSRIVALWLVFIMLATPFFARAGLEKDTKAADIVPTVDTTVRINETHIGINDEGKVCYAAAYGNGEVKYYGIKGIKNNVTSYLYNSADFSTELQEIEVSLGDPAETYTITGVDVKFKLYENEADIDNPVEESELMDAGASIDLGNREWYIVTYVKLQGTNSADEPFESAYTKYQVAKYSYVDPFANFNAKLVDSSNADVQDGNTYDEVKVEFTGGDLGTYAANDKIGEFKLGYRKGDDNITWSDITSATNYSSYKTIEFPAGLEGKYTVYMGYFVDGSKVTDERYIGQVNVDTKSAAITDAGLYYSSNGNFSNNKTKLSADKEYLSGDENKFRYYITLDEYVNASQVELYVDNVKKNVTFHGEGQQEGGKFKTFYCEADAYTGTVVIKAIDNAGYTLTSIALPVIVPVAASSYESYTIVWPDADGVDTLVPVDGTASSNPAELLNAKRTLKISATTPYNSKINRIKVVDVQENNGTPKDFELESVDVTSQESYPTWSFNNVEISVPKIDDTNANYDNVYIVFYGNNNTEIKRIAFMDILFDQTNPLVEIVTGDESNSYSWTKDKPEITFKVTSGNSTEYESDIASVQYKIGSGEVKDITADANGIYTIPEEDIIAASDNNGVKVYIYAEDDATNKAENGNGFSFTYYYDDENPKFSETNPISLIADGNTYPNKIEDEEGNLVPNEIYVKDQKVQLVMNCDDNIGVKKIEYQLIGPNGITGPFTQEYGNIYSRTYENNEKLSEGTYTFKAKYYDAAGRVSGEEEITFTVDRTPPEQYNIVVETKAYGTETWVEFTNFAYDPFFVSWGNFVNKKVVYIPKNTSSGYRIKVTATDTLSPIDELAIADKASDNDNHKYTVDIGEDPYDGVFYLVLDPSKLDSHDYGYRSYYEPVIELVDRAQNNSGEKKIDEPKFSATSTHIEVTAGIYEGSVDDDEQPLEGDAIAALEKGTNKLYTVRVHVSAPSEVSSESVYLTYKVKNETTGEYDVKKIMASSVVSNIPDDQRDVVNYIADYEIPTDANVIFDDFMVYADDTGEAGEVTYDLVDILFDKTSPVVTDTTAVEGVYPALVAPTEWVQSVDVPYYVFSGDMLADESIDDYTDIAESDLINVAVSVNGNANGGEQLTDVKMYNGNISLTESSPSIDGTEVVITARDMAGNEMSQPYYFKVDSETPNGSVSIKDQNSNSIYNFNPTLVVKANDNLTIDSAVVNVVAPNGTTYKKEFLSGIEEANVSRTLEYSLSTIVGAENYVDGNYQAYVTVTDMAGNPKTSDTIYFKVDTKAPVVKATISGGTKSTKSDYYYSTPVSVQLKIDEKDGSDIKVWDNDTLLSVTWSTAPGADGYYTATVSVLGDGEHIIQINATDAANNPATPAKTSFMIDTVKPNVDVTLNGGLVYKESMGVRDYSSNVNLNASVTDTNRDDNDLRVQVVQTKPDQETTTSQYVSTNVRNFTYSEEADYTINLYAVDWADNASDTRSVKFRVDKTAPRLSIGGVGSGSSANAVTVSFTMEEAFWQDASGTVTIYRKPGDGQAETLLKTIDINPTAYQTVVRETLTDTGVYRIEFTASDRVGHVSNAEQEFTIDREAPVVKLTSASNYEITDKIVETTIEISDDFYTSKRIDLKGTRTDAEGKVHDIDFGSYNAAGNPTVISVDFTEDGIYDISVTATDVAGNSDSESVHFTIDKSEPVIADLSDIDGKVLKEFTWEYDPDELVSDLTVCDVHMYLNGSEYDGKSAIEDGSYTLLVTAEDENGHYVEKEFKFTLDTKEPVFIVTGVEDGEVKNEAYEISVSLQLEEDSLLSVTLNGKEQQFDSNICTISITEKGDYVLEMTAVDEAGNESSMKIEFKYGEEAQWWWWILIALGVLALFFIFFIILKKSKKDKEDK